jgi:predicted permease
MPNWNHIVRQHLAVLRLPPEREIEIVEELALHLEAAYEAALADGLSEAEAEARAVQGYDWRLLECELSRAEQPLAARALQPSTALLRPLPFQNPNELVMVWETAPKLGFPHNDVAPANFIDWRDQNQVFTHIAAFGGASLSLTGRGEPERIEGERVSASLFPLLGVVPALGRVCSEQEDRSEAPGVIVLSHGLWQRRFGGDPGVVGQSLTLDNRPYTVVGVMPAHFRFPGREQEFWTPMAFEPEEAAGRGDHYLGVVARLKPGVTRQRAQAEMDAIAARLQQQYPRTNTDQGVALVSLHEEFAGAIRKPLLILLGVVGFVLLIACANLTNLLLARATERASELTIRAALGASRLRLVRQLLTENILLSLAGGAIGALLAVWGVDLLETLIPENLSQARGVVVDGRVLAFSAVVSLLTGVVFGLAPALQVSRLNMTEGLKEGGRGGAGSGLRGRMRGALVVGEIALSLVLLTGAGLMIKSFHRLTGVDPGFQPDRTLTMRMQLSGEKYGDPVKRRAFYDQMLQQAQSIPGVQSASVITQLPLTTQGLSFSFSLEGQPPLPAANLPQAAFRVISQDYFRAMGIPMLLSYCTSMQGTLGLLVQAGSSNQVYDDCYFTTVLLSGRGPMTTDWLTQFGNDLGRELDPSRSIGRGAYAVQTALSTPVGDGGDVHVQDLGCRLGRVTPVSTRLIAAVVRSFRAAGGDLTVGPKPQHFARREFAATSGV